VTLVCALVIAVIIVAVVVATVVAFIPLYNFRAKKGIKITRFNFIDNNLIKN